MDRHLNVCCEAPGDLETKGFYTFKGFFPVSKVEQAKLEVENIFETDLRQRAELKISEAWNKKGDCVSILTKPTHILLDAYGKSSTLDTLVEEILTNPVSREVLRKLAGPHIKFRGYNIQKLTGKNDPRPSYGVAPNPHEWHRDSPGELGIAIFLEDVPGPGNGATSFVPGSHHFPFCPRWNALLGPPYIRNLGVPGLSFFLRWNIFSRILARRVVANKQTGAYGVQGDFYIFINDVWHGREPNIHGRTGIKVMIGAYPTCFAFPDTVGVPDTKTLEVLPPHVRFSAGGYDSEHLDPKLGDTLIERMLHNRETRNHHWSFMLARLERKLADRVSSFSGQLRSLAKLLIGKTR
jgi:hypothetical protein